MISRIFEIAVLIFVLCSGLFGLFYSIRLRIKSNEMAMPNIAKGENQDVVRIFEEMERKAIEINPELAVAIEGFKVNQESLETYQEYIYTTFNQSATSTSNHVTI